MPVNKNQTANLQQYTETQQPNGDILVTAQYLGTPISQYIHPNPPSIVMFDPNTMNLVVIDSPLITPGLQFVEIIQSVTSAAQVG